MNPDIIARMGMDNSKFKRGLAEAADRSKSAKKDFEALNNSFGKTSALAIGFGAMVGTFRSIVGWANEMKDSTDANVIATQEWGRAMSGVGQEVKKVSVQVFGFFANVAKKRGETVAVWLGLGEALPQLTDSERALIALYKKQSATLEKIKKTDDVFAKKREEDARRRLSLAEQERIAQEELAKISERIKGQGGIAQDKDIKDRESALADLYNIEKERAKLDDALAKARQKAAGDMNDYLIKEMSIKDQIIAREKQLVALKETQKGTAEDILEISKREIELAQLKKKNAEDIKKLSEDLAKAEYEKNYDNLSIENKIINRQVEINRLRAESLWHSDEGREDKRLEAEMKIIGMERELKELEKQKEDRALRIMDLAEHRAKLEKDIADIGKQRLSLEEAKEKGGSTKRRAERIERLEARVKRDEEREARGAFAYNDRARDDLAKRRLQAADLRAKGGFESNPEAAAIADQTKTLKRGLEDVVREIERLSRE